MIWWLVQLTNTLCSRGLAKHERLDFRRWRFAASTRSQHKPANQGRSRKHDQRPLSSPTRRWRYWAALIDEGHLGKFTDSSLVLERLKAISGGSEQTVDRKGLAALPSVALKVRFTIAVNELPRLSDSSAAMRSRLLVLPYFNTYEGQEDIGLLDRLLAEIPGITNWALEGLRLLRNGGRFHNPAAGEKILRDFVYLSSSVQAFLDECCELVPNNEVRRNDLQMAWHIWCDENGHIPGSAADFGRKLRAVVPRVDDQQRRTEGRRDRWYVGVGLTSEAHATVARARNGA